MATNEEELENDDQEQPDEQREIKVLRQKAKQLAEEQAKRQALERELAFAKAGLPFDKKGLDYFRKGYDGEMTPEAIKAAAIEAGFIQPPSDQVSDEEKQAHERVADASAGGQAAAKTDWGAEIGKANTAEEVMAIARRAGIPITWDNQ